MYTVHIQVSQKVLKLILCPHKVGSVGRSARKPLTNCGERGLFAGRVGECWLKFGREDVRSSHGRSSPRPKTPHAVGGHGGPHLPPYFRPHLPSTPHPPHQSSHLSLPKTPHFSSKYVEALADSVGVFGRERWWEFTGLEGGPWRRWVSRRGSWTRRPHGRSPPYAQ